MSALLIAVTWLAGIGPQISMQALQDLPACRHAMRTLAEDIAQVARRNTVGAHRPVLDLGIDQVVLRSEATGREIARIRCVAASPGRMR
jgi:hypothetical protein